MSLEFTETEMMVCATARLMEDGKTYFIGFGMPQIAMVLAQHLYAPNIAVVYEYGVIGPRIPTPFEPLILGDSNSNYKAAAWKDMNHVFFQASLGLIDYGMLGALQVDQYGNINSTAIGTYGEKMRRFGGPGGADSIAALCWRTILMTDQDRRKFIERVDFISSPGFLDGSPGARERAGLPRGTGPWRVVTPWAVYDYNEERRLRLIAVAPWVTVEQVVEECEHKPVVAEKIATMDVPTDEELDILRSQLDVAGQFSGARGAWIVWDGEKYARQEQE